MFWFGFLTGFATAGIMGLLVLFFVGIGEKRNAHDDVSRFEGGE